MASAEKTAKARSNPLSEGKEFLTGSISELKKVTSPTRQEAMQATIVTLIIIAFMSVCLFLLDLFFHSVISLVIR